QRRARVFAEARRLVLKQRVDGYVRVSRIGGRAGDGYISPEVQREQISAFAGLMDVEIDAWHDDRDYSGGNVERPGFLEAIRRVESGETGGVIVARIDRFARSAPDGGAMVRRIIDAGGIFASAQERIDPTTDFGKAMLNIMFVMAELQLDQLKSGWKTAKGRAIKRGAHIGPTPFGYTRVARGGDGSGTLVPDPATAPAVTKLFRRAAAGAGVSERGRCHSPSMLVADRLEGWVIERVRELLSGTEVRAEPVASNDELARLAQAVASAEAELDAFMLDLGNRERYGARFETYLDARLRALEDAEAAYAAAAARPTTTPLAPLSWDDLDADELHTVVAGAIDAVFIRRPPRRGANVA